MAVDAMALGKLNECHSLCCSVLLPVLHAPLLRHFMTHNSYALGSQKVIDCKLAGEFKL
jgi:hypothetical protein